MQQTRILFEGDPNEFKSLLFEKYQKANRNNQFKTVEGYAKHEAKNLAKMWNSQYQLFPILEQWIDYLLQYRELLLSKEQVLDIKTKYNSVNLNSIILELSKLQGYEKPSDKLELLFTEVKKVNDPDFEMNFILNIHNICKDNSQEFWNDSHRKNITNWLYKNASFDAGFTFKADNGTVQRVPLFETTWTTNLKNESINKDNTKFTFKNNFDHVSTDTIHNYFKEKLVNKGLLTESDLNEYLKIAFESKSEPITRFIIKKALKKEIICVFYSYYDIAGKVHGKQKVYAALLGEYFEGYSTNNVSSNFSKYCY